MGEKSTDDAEGRDISSELQPPSLDKIEHVPFIHLEGKAIASPSTMQGIYSPVILYQMNEPMQTPLNGSRIEGTLLQNKGIGDYANLWGIKNFATSRILTRDQVAEFSEQGPAPLEKADLYLELRHSPSIETARMMRDEYGRLRPMLGTATSILPLNENHLRAIFDNLYTARFVVENGFAKRYGSSQRGGALPSLPDVPDGCYEFYYGKPTSPLGRIYHRTSSPTTRSTPLTKSVSNSSTIWDRVRHPLGPPLQVSAAPPLPLRLL